jgi:hypothetical protein
MQMHANIHNATILDTRGRRRRLIGSSDQEPHGYFGLSLVTVPLAGLVQETLVASTTMPHGSPPGTRVVGVPPSTGTFITAPGLELLTQYTLVASTAILPGLSYPEASMVGVPPSSAAFMTLPLLVQ